MGTWGYKCLSLIFYLLRNNRLQEADGLPPALKADCLPPAFLHLLSGQLHGHMAAYATSCPFCSLAGSFLICLRHWGPEISVLSASLLFGLSLSDCTAMALNSIPISIPVTFF